MTKDLSLTNHVPAVKKCLETFVFRVKVCKVTRIKLTRKTLTLNVTKKAKFISTLVLTFSVVHHVPFTFPEARPFSHSLDNLRTQVYFRSSLLSKDRKYVCIRRLLTRGLEMFSQSTVEPQDLSTELRLGVSFRQCLHLTSVMKRFGLEI